MSNSFTICDWNAFSQLSEKIEPLMMDLCYSWVFCRCGKTLIHFHIKKKVLIWLIWHGSSLRLCYSAPKESMQCIRHWHWNYPRINRRLKKKKKIFAINRDCKTSCTCWTNVRLHHTINATVYMFSQIMVLYGTKRNMLESYTQFVNRNSTVSSANWSKLWIRQTAIPNNTPFHSYMHTTTHWWQSHHMKDT